MSWFKKKPTPPPPVADVKQAIVEIEAHKDAEREAVQQAKEASRQLNTLLVENGFTLKIYLAAGGQKRKH
jgi:predicted ribonuclease YlaK